MRHPSIVVAAMAWGLGFSSLVAEEAAPSAPPPPPQEAPAPKPPVAKEEKADVGYLGLTASEVDPEDREDFGLKEGQEAVFVKQVSPGGPAAKGGVQDGDLLLEVDHKPVGTPEVLGEVVQGCKPGAKIDLQVLREGKPQTLSVAVGSRAELQRQMQAQQDRMMAMMPPAMQQKARELQEKAKTLGKKYQDEGLSPEEISKRIQEDLKPDQEELQRMAQEAFGGGGGGPGR